MTHWSDKYLGIPFVPGGRGFDGCDCGGLVLMVLRGETGIDPLDTHSTFPRRSLATGEGKAVMAGIIEDCARDWVRLPEGAAVEPFDAVVYRWGGAACHCGIAVDGSHVLHVETHHASHIDRIKLKGYEIDGIYRHSGKVSPGDPS